MKKGELVTLRLNLQASDQALAYAIASKELWQNPGVIVRGVYEGQIRSTNSFTGKTYATEITPAVDIMIIGILIVITTLHTKIATFQISS